MAIEIKRPTVDRLFAIGSTMGAGGNNTINAPQADSFDQQASLPQGQQADDGGGVSGMLAQVGGKVAAKGASNYATTGSLFGGAAGAGTAAASGSTAASGVGYGLGGSLVSGGIGGATYAAGGAAAGGAAASGAAAGGAAAGGTAAAGAGSAGAMSSAGPIGMIAAAIMLNEQDSQKRGLRREGNDYYKDLATGKVLKQDIDGKWAPMTDSIFGEKTGLGNDQRMFGDLMSFDFKSAGKNFKKSSLARGFGLWG